MSCGSLFCEWELKKKLNSMAGINNASVNLATSKADIRFVPGLVSVSQIKEAIEALGYGVNTQKIPLGRTG